MEYENELYKVIANEYDNIYYVVNKDTNVVEARESALPTAKYRADGLRDATYKFEGK